MIYVITHKKFDDSILDNEKYKVLHVGKNNDYKHYYLRDDIGDSISEKNANYCELTGLYWIWRNAKEKNDEIDGIVHYRRYFTTTKQNFLYNYFGIMPSILPYETIETSLKNYDIILPKRRKAIRRVRETYSYFHDAEDLKILEEVIEKVSPEYIGDYRRVLNRHSYYYANMMICRHKLLEEYAEWLFRILNETEKHIDLNKYTDSYQKRVFGFMSERLLQVWVMHNGLKVKEYDVFNTEERGDTFIKSNIKRVKRIFGKNEK